MPAPRDKMMAVSGAGTLKAALAGRNAAGVEAMGAPGSPARPRRGP